MKTEKTKTPTGMSEVSAKFVHESEAASTEAAPTTGKTEIQRLYQQAIPAHEEMERSEEDHDGSWERWDALRARIMQTPATGPLDVAIKLRLYASGEIVDRPETLPKEGNTVDGWLRTAICDLERLDLRSLTGADALLEKLAADYHAACEAGDRAQDTLDAARQPDAPVSLAESGERAILVRMLDIEAGGLRGVRAKIQAMMPPFAWKRLTGPDTSEFDPLVNNDMLRSVVVDIERFAGGFATKAKPLQFTQVEIDLRALKEDENLLNHLDRWEALRGKFNANIDDRVGLSYEIESLEGRIIGIRPDTFSGVRGMLRMAHAIMSAGDIDPGIFLGSGPATAAIARAIVALDDADGAIYRLED